MGFLGGQVSGGDIMGDDDAFDYALEAHQRRATSR